MKRRLACLLWSGLFSGLACASENGASPLDIWWGAPFAGLLLSIAVFPLLAPRVWHAHYGKVAAAWALAFILPFAARFGAAAAAHTLAHAALAEYLPFIALLAALYTVAGGIHVRGSLPATAGANTALLALGTALASVMGTTGAAMLLIRPLLRANAGRDAAHLVVFFIFLVANVGGALSPLGDPPLFLGFLQGVGFFWTTRHLALPMLCVVVLALAAFYVIDRRAFRLRPMPAHVSADHRVRFGIDGRVNCLLLLVVLGLVLLSGVWRSGRSVDVLGVPVALQNLLRDVALFVVLLLSVVLTPRSVRAGNEFGWEPIGEVAKLFAAIFVTITPVLTMLQAGEHGPLASVFGLVRDQAGQPVAPAYFWATGLLSSLLDNAPTYLVFFNMAGGDAHALMQEASILAAISAGAVFMGALTYIGNAPNLMVKAIAESRGVRMPGFFGYMLWSMAVLGPLLLLVTALFFRG
jgi:Na+/H+ antiporter NhaD/arsenite permease-like protein